MRWRDSERLDWAAIAENVCQWAAGCPAGTVRQEIADLCLPFPADKDMIGFVDWTLRRKRSVTPAMLEVLRGQWAQWYVIGTSLSGQLRARHRSRRGEPVTAWYPDELQQKLASGSRPAQWPVLLSEAA
jgi:hypothetical protein